MDQQIIRIRAIMGEELASWPNYLSPFTFAASLNALKHYTKNLETVIDANPSLFSNKKEFLTLLKNFTDYLDQQTQLLLSPVREEQNRNFVSPLTHIQNSTKRAVRHTFEIIDVNFKKAGLITKKT